MDEKPLPEVAAFLDQLRKMGVKSYTDGRISVTFDHDKPQPTPRRKPGPFAGEAQ